MTAAKDISYEVALSKITPPRQTRATIERNRALEALQECLRYKIVTIEAPSGSAKTGLLAEAQRRLGAMKGKYRTAWLTVDAADDRRRLARHVLAAFKTMWPDLDEQGLMELYDAAPENYSIALANALYDSSVNNPDLTYVLFVDDLHKAAPNAIAEFLNAVAEYHPANVRVVATGNYLLWECLDIRFRDDAVAYPAEMLNLDVEETRELLERVIGNERSVASMSAPDLRVLAANLQQITQGWFLGVRTYADGLARGIIEPGVEVEARQLGRQLNRFFREKVLDALPEDYRRFVIETGVPDRICPELCNAMTGGDDAHAILKDLDARNCFISPCAGKSGWYEYHPLFRRWLHRKEEQLDAAERDGICWRASVWCARHWLADEAAKYMLMSSESAFVEGLVAASGYDVGHEGLSFFDWMGATLASRFSESPVLSLMSAWGYVCVGDSSRAHEWASAYEGLLGPGEEVSLDVSLVHEKCLEFDCRYEEALVSGREILAKGEAGMAMEHRCLLMHSLAEAYVRVGDFENALKNYLQGEVMAELSGSDFFVSMCRMGIIWLDVVQGDLKGALELAGKAIGECPRTLVTYGALLTAKAFACIETGDFEAAGRCIEASRESLSATHNVDMLYESNAVEALYLAFVGKGARGYRLVTKTALEIGERAIPRSMNLFVFYLQGHVALQMGYLPEARAAARAVAERAGKDDIVYQLLAEELGAYADRVDGGDGENGIESLVAAIDRAHGAGARLSELGLSICAADAFAQAGKRADALMYMNRALRIQTGQHVVAPFLASGVETRSLLHEIVDVRKSSGIARKLAKTVLRSFAENEPEEDVEKDTSAPAARFGLTAREVEVLELLDSGLSRREIAETLSVSLNTVKSHVSNIYSKLGVTNRIDAFAVVHGDDA